MNGLPVGCDFKAPVPVDWLGHDKADPQPDTRRVRDQEFAATEGGDLNVLWSLGTEMMNIGLAYYRSQGMIRSRTGDIWAGRN